MSDKYSVVVVGLGKRGGHHTSAFQASDRFEVTGICDIDEPRMAEAKGELGPKVETSTDAAALAAASGAVNADLKSPGSFLTAIASPA